MTTESETRLSCPDHPNDDRMYTYTATGKRYICETCRRELGEEYDVRIDAAELAQLRADAGRVKELETENNLLTSLINCPHNDDWFDGVKIEAAHQQVRWGAEHDAGKTPADWFWLVGYLAGKCLHSVIAGNVEKAKHHTISTAAVLLNWWRAISGENTSMRPGIDSSAIDAAMSLDAAVDQLPQTTGEGK